jgi:hypothetical protein
MIFHDLIEASRFKNKQVCKFKDSFGAMHTVNIVDKETLWWKATRMGYSPVYATQHGILFEDDEHAISHGGYISNT